MTRFQMRMRWLTWTLLLSVLLISGWSARLNAACSKTVWDAAHAQENIVISALDGPGYRVTAVQWDALLQQHWAQVVDCRHPEWPAVSVMLEPKGLTNRSNTGPRPTINSWRSSDEPLVHIGDVVRLWRQEEAVRIELQGVAEESGAIGTRIRVRLLRGFGDKNNLVQRLHGVVCGHDDVEL